MSVGLLSVDGRWPQRKPGKGTEKFGKQAILMTKQRSLDKSQSGHLINRQ